ncbi:class I SAM-dependent methyltransferase [Spartinivicinus marinus]|uniref:class I SAM-dependent methyltransferase n=1 Tax=Spartinivicinus marinus TaxID=2994442 RepID=UPI0015D780AA|nr:class I SAM-dependent methyltransferase [Spartinivicinus marinus]
MLEFLKEPSTEEEFEVEVFESCQLSRNIEIKHVRCNQWCHKNNTSPLLINKHECNSCYTLEIISGKLTSKQTKVEYPIIKGVPRILPLDILKDTLEKNYSDFLEKFEEKFSFKFNLKIKSENKNKNIINSFSYQWTTFINNYDHFKDIFLSFTKPFLKEEDFKNKIMLEVGCGSGRPAVTACKMGAEVIGMDISRAVDSAYIQSEKIAMLHIVQADAYAPPFKQKFDVVYSVGVLQHIPSPQKALEGIRTTLSEVSPLILWVYGERELWYKPIELFRKISVKLPHKLLHAISILLAILSELFLLIPYRVMSKISALDKISKKVPGRIYARFPFRENVVGWFDRLSAPVTYYFNQEYIHSLLDKTGYSNIEIAARKNASASWVIRATRNRKKKV